MKNNKKFYDVREIKDLRDLINQSAKLYSDRPAFEVKDKSGKQYQITYKQYHEEIQALGTALVDMGLSGEKIAVGGDNSYEWCLSYMATVTGVGVIVPVDKELLFDDINMILNTADVKLFFCDKKIAKKLNERKDELKKDLTVVMMHTQKEDGVLNITDLVAKGKELLKNGDTRYLDAEIDPEAMCSLLFTSGTTGMSKGVMLCHKNFCYEVKAAMGVIKIYPEDCGISMLPLHHTYESTIILFFAPYCGAKVTFCDGFKYVLKNMKEFNPSVFVAVPLLLETVHRRLMKAVAAKPHGLTLFKVGSVLVKAAAKVGIDLKKVFFKEIIDTFGGNMRLIICGAAPINPQILKDFEAFGIQIIFGYGLTECAPLAILNHDRLHLAESVGEVIPGSEAKILDPDENGVGEICVKGDMVMLGYYNNPEETAKVIDKDGWFHTGDLGYMDKKGCFYISGRCKNVIVTSNGKNIYPEELEYHLGTDIRVGEALVLGDKNSKGEVIVAARIFPNFEELSDRYGKSADKFTDDELKKIFKEVVDGVNAKLPPFKKIVDFKIRRTEFVKTTTSKIMRHKNND
ncbi:MAG: AMP-binding protein [Clostridia bacterium]|nr:AMP-binding protein [Clostridia bacterium]